MATAFVIEKDRPLPKEAHHRAKYPFPNMDVGDSFYSPDATVRNAAYAYADRRNNIKFTVRAEGDGFRVWRVE